MDLKAKLEKSEVIEESLREQLEEKEGMQEEFEKEIVSLRRNLEKENIKQNFDKSVEMMNQIINNQRPIHDKSGLGYNKEDEKHKIGTWNSKKHEANTSFSKDESEVARHEHVQRKEALRRTEQEGHQEDGPTPQEGFRKETTSRRNQTFKYEKCFNGYCFSCNQFGHKALDCKHYPRRSVERNQTPRYEKNFNGYCFSCNQFGHKALNCRIHARRSVGSPNNSLRCWKCNHTDHIASFGQTMRCYSCSGFGHKAQECYNSRRQQMRNVPYNSIRKSHEYWKENDVERMKSKRIAVEDKGHSQTWMKKIEQLNIGEVDDCDRGAEEGCHMAL